MKLVIILSLIMIFFIVLSVYYNVKTYKEQNVDLKPITDKISKICYLLFASNVICVIAVLLNKIL